MRRLLSGLCAGALVAGALVDCGTFGGEAVRADSADAADSAVTTSDDASTTTDSAQPDALDDARGPCTAGCAGTAGACGVKVGDFCIDATEVTVADFRAFTKSANGTTIDVSAPCAPVSVATLGVRPDETLPMTDVSFCAARAFCKWAGKRLCGSTGGGPLLPSQTRTQVSAWYNACTGGTADTIHLLSDGGCQLEAGAPRSPSSSGCQGGVTGAFDMIGNVWEWIDQPNEVEGGVATAVIIGGGYAEPVTTNCRDIRSARVDFVGNDIGFRCCSP